MSTAAAAAGTRTRETTCLVGGWTEPRGTRPFFGGLLLGVEDGSGQLRYVGHAAAGFNDAAIGRIWTRLHVLETRVCPFTAIPRTRERAHWVRPGLAIRVTFAGWTADGKLRHPAYSAIAD